MCTNVTIRRRICSSGVSPLRFDFVERAEQALERILMAREENLFLVPEVVVEIALLHVQRGGDLFDRRAVVAEAAKRGGGALQDFDARGVGLARFAVRRRCVDGVVRRVAELAVRGS